MHAWLMMGPFHACSSSCMHAMRGSMCEHALLRGAGGGVRAQLPLPELHVVVRGRAQKAAAVWQRHQRPHLAPSAQHPTSET